MPLEKSASLNETPNGRINEEIRYLSHQFKSSSEKRSEKKSLKDKKKTQKIEKSFVA